VTGHLKYAFKILQWLTYSARPLEPKEVAEVIAIDIEESPRLDPRNRFPELRDILTICSSLISLEFKHLRIKTKVTTKAITKVTELD